MAEVGLGRAVRAQHLQGPAGEPLAEGEVDLGRPAVAAGRHQPAVVEDLPGVELARAQDGGLRLPDGADQGMELRERVRRLLEDDVLGGAEHPVREVPGVELRERHREADPHVLDPAHPSGPHVVEQAGEGGVPDVVVVHSQGQVQAIGQRLQLPRVGAGERHRLLDQDADPHLQQLPGHLDVEVRRHQDVGDVDPGELGDRADGDRHPPLAGGGAGPLEVGVAYRHQLDPRRLGEDVAVELRHVPGADEGDAERSACRAQPMDSNRDGSGRGVGSAARRRCCAGRAAASRSQRVP